MIAPPLAVVSAIGVGQILAWGTSFYMTAVIAAPLARETGWSMASVVAGHSVGLVAAGVAAPFVGRAIEAYGGRRVLACASLLFALGLVALACASNQIAFYAAWIVLGLGMACGLYDAAFSTLGQIFRDRARRAITNVTLFGGLASTICWPLSALMIESVGWRTACLVYAGAHLALVLPLHLFLVPPAPPVAPPAQGKRAEPRMRERQDRRLFLLVAAVSTLAMAIASIISVHLIALLQARGLPLAVAVGMGALFGPAQVVARIVELAIGRFYHPVWTMFGSTALVGGGVLLLWGSDGPALIAASLLLYGAGNGIHSIAKGTTPLALFGAEGYARLMGRLALPALVAQAASPPLAALVLERAGAGATYVLLGGLGLFNIGLCVALLLATRIHRAA